MIMKIIVCLICISYVIIGVRNLYNDTGYTGIVKHRKR